MFRVLRSQTVNLVQQLQRRREFWKIGLTLFVLLVSVGVSPMCLPAVWSGTGNQPHAENVRQSLPARTVAVATGKVAIYAPNPRYLQDANGNPIVLIGFGNEVKNPAAVLDQLAGKINYQRAYVTWFHTTGSTGEYERGTPFPKNGALWDLAAWDATFWSNLHDYISKARERGIIVGLTIWDGHSALPGGKFGDQSLWNSDKNVQGIQWAYDDDALANFPNPNPASSNAQERLVYYQRRWIDRLINEVKDYPNVIIELDNETDQASEEWWLWWADYFINKGDFVIATTWNDQYTISDSTFSTDPRLHMKSYHTRSDTIITSERYVWNKVIVADADDSCSNLDATNARKIAWQSFLRGGHWNDFVCFGELFPDSVKIDYYGKLLDFLKTGNVPFWEMAPANNLVTSGFALAKTGSHYLIYLPAGGSTTVDLSVASGTLDVEWYNPRTGEVTPAGTTTGGSNQNFTAPFSGDAVLHIGTESELSRLYLPLILKSS
jgi:hypothetical protein